MLRIERILCPVDFSHSSAAAYDYARSLARHYEAKLFVQHVVEQLVAIGDTHIPQEHLEELYRRQQADAEERLRQLASNVADGVQQEFILQRGGPAADSILSFAEDQEIDLIVMGTHGRRGLDRLVMGSVLERILRKTRSPLLAVRTAHSVAAGEPNQDVEIRRILFCTDFSEDSPRALEYALSLALQYGSELALLHVLESSRGERELEQHKQKARATLQEIVPEEVTQWASITPVIRTGRAYQQIVRYANEMTANLIVMGVRGRNPVDVALFGSTTHRVVQLGPCPVLVVRT
jgi:nucleotide-binding universal stress UspA family protein